MKKIILIILVMGFGLLHAQYTAIPDPNFEQVLIDKGIDSEGTIDGQVLTSDINTITELWIENTIINYMTGIEGFSALTNLTVINNENLTHLNLNENNELISLSCNYNLSLILNIEDNTSIETLICYGNAFNNLEIGNKPNLAFLVCSINMLSTIDVSQCPNLEALVCEVNMLTEIDLSHNPNLWYLNIADNELINIDLSSNLDLKVLFIWTNNLETINLDQNIALEQLFCSNNSLTSLSVRNNANELITDFYALNNPDLTCVYVDDRTYSNMNWNEGVDENTHFVETEAQCESISIIENKEITLSVYPNPFNNYLEVNSFEDKNIQIELFDILGDKVLTTTNRTIDTSIIPTAFYIIRITSEDGLIHTEKLFKE